MRNRFVGTMWSSAACRNEPQSQDKANEFLLQAETNTVKQAKVCSSKMHQQSENPTVHSKVASGLTSTAVGLKMRK